MAKTLGTDKWALKLDLPPGEYEFKFFVDGNWVHDEGQPSKTNEMGTLNNVINVAAASDNRDLEATVASKTVPPCKLSHAYNLVMEIGGRDSNLENSMIRFDSTNFSFDSIRLSIWS